MILSRWRHQFSSRAVGAAFCLAAILAAPSCGPDVTDADIDLISMTQFRQLTETSPPGAVAILDARSPREFAVSHIPGARNVRAERYRPESPRDRALDATDVIVVYGRDKASQPARALVKRLLALGYEDVRFYAGGMSEWSIAELPTTGAGASAGADGAEPKADDKPAEKPETKIEPKSEPK